MGEPQRDLRVAASLRGPYLGSPLLASVLRAVTESPSPSKSGIGGATRSLPHWGGIIPNQDLAALVAYLKTLK